jgi:molybdate transport system substrate-binding protein
MRARSALLAGLLASVFAAPAAGGCGKSQGDDGKTPLRVAGASDLVFVMEEIVRKFEAESGEKVDFVPGSSGKLAAQIREGAPFDVFFSANETFVDDVVAAGACKAASKSRYARGRIVMWSQDEERRPPATLAGLSDPSYRRIAIAQPDHAPYGAAARHALQKVGAWSAVEARVVYGSSIKETMQIARTGNADVAIIALSLAMKSNGAYVEIPEDQHGPINQALAVCTHGARAELGDRFAAFMKTPAIRELMTSYGFAVP